MPRADTELRGEKQNHEQENGHFGTSLAVPWLRLRASNAWGVGGAGSIPGQGTKIPHAAQRGQEKIFKKKKKVKERKRALLSIHRLLIPLAATWGWPHGNRAELRGCPAHWTLSTSR